MHVVVGFFVLTWLCVCIGVTAVCIAALQTQIVVCIRDGIWRFSRMNMCESDCADRSVLCVSVCLHVGGG